MHCLLSFLIALNEPKPKKKISCKLCIPESTILKITRSFPIAVEKIIKEESSVRLKVWNRNY